MKSLFKITLVFIFALTAVSFVDALIFIYNKVGQIENVQQWLGYSAIYAATGGGVVHGVLNLLEEHLNPWLLLHALMELIVASVVTFFVARKLRH